MNPLKVMIVEDSVVVREMLVHIIDSDPRLKVESAVGSGEEALRALAHCTPDVISIDIRLPGMDGFETTLRIMSEKPTPIVVISSDVDDYALNISMNALRAGALSVVAKPDGFASTEYQKVANRICDQLVAMSSVKVVRQRFTRDLKLTSASTGTPKATTSFNGAPAIGRGSYHMLGLVASTGGPNALTQVLQALPKNFPLPISIVQHITDGFLESFAHWLGQETPFPTTLVRKPMIFKGGHIYMAPPGHHLTVVGGQLVPTTAPPVGLQRPSGTVLLETMAQSLGRGAFGVVLTGMGDDGARGLLRIREAGGYTIAEHQSTAVVYGMPASAERLGAAREMLPLDQIGARITEMISSSTGEHQNVR